MTKEDLVKKISKDSNIKIKITSKIFDRVIDLITKDIRKKRSVSISDFGKFEIVRQEMKILQDRNNKIVIPPKDIIEFNISVNFKMNPNRLDKNRIISAISIEFGLSRELSKTVVNNIFNSIKQHLKKNKNIEIQKFGKFKLSPEKDSDLFNVKFAPSKKLSARVNSNFENLKKVKMETDFLRISEDRSESKTNEVKARSINDTGEAVIIDASQENEEIVISELPRKLISEDVIKLHNEITKKEESETSKTNLWG